MIFDDQKTNVLRPAGQPSELDGIRLGLTGYERLTADIGPSLSFGRKISMKRTKFGQSRRRLRQGSTTVRQMVDVMENGRVCAQRCDLTREKRQLVSAEWKAFFEVL